MLVPAVAVLGATIALVVVRPTLGRWRLHPAAAAAGGAGALWALGAVSAANVVATVRELFFPLVTVASVMTTTAAAHRMQIFDRLARSIEIRTRGPVPHAFRTVFLIAALTATLFNNDAAILILTPIVVPLTKRLYPKRPYLVEPFAFAIFVAAGVAPLSTSNPMNLVVAERAGIAFHAYALRMIPVAAASSYVSYRLLRWAYRSRIEDDVPAGGREAGSMAPLDAAPKVALAIVFAGLVAYPVMSLLGGPVWIVAFVSAALTFGIGLRHGSVVPQDLVRGVAWDVLLFMFLLLVMATGLRTAGLLDVIASVYRLGGETTVGQTSVIAVGSAIGSAALNNHPMAALNAIALDSVAPRSPYPVLAALVGGDLGPRLLPMGSLAGLLWLDLLSSLGLRLEAKTFVRVGLITTLPALAVGLAVLWLEAWVFG